MKSLDLYRAIQSAALVAPTVHESEVSESVLHRARERAINAGRPALFTYWCTVATTSGADFHRDAAHDEAAGELMELECRSLAPKFLTFKHAAGRIKIRNTAERLQAFAAEMLKGGAWALWGGGEKPAETIKPKKARAVTWKASLIKVAAEALQDGQPADFLAIAMEQLGGLAYSGNAGKTFILYAPEPAEGLPEGFHVARRCDGMWICSHAVSGVALGRAAKVKSHAVASALDQMEQAGPEKMAQAIARISGREMDHGAALAAWRQTKGIGTQADIETRRAAVDAYYAAPAAPAAAETVATAPSTQEETPADTAAEVAPVAAAISDVAKDRLYNLIAVNEKTGEVTQLNKSPMTHHEAATSKGRFSDHACRRIELSELASTESTQAPTAAAIVSASVVIGVAQASSTQAEEVSEEETQAAEACEMAEAAACAEAAEAIGRTPAEQAGGPSDYMDPLKTQAQATDYTSTVKTLRADYLRAADGGHVQHASSKTGAWSAVMFRTSDGAAGLAFKRPGLPVDILQHSSGAERMRALQAMARTAEQEAGAAAAQARATDSPQAAYLRQLASGLTSDEMLAMARDLEHDNYHGAALKWRCMAAGAFDLAARAAASITAQDAAGYLTNELGRERAAIADDLRARALPATDYTEALKTQGTDCSGPVETLPGGRDGARAGLAAVG
jgi:hypothetical protein